MSPWLTASEGSAARARMRVLRSLGADEDLRPTSMRTCRADEVVDGQLATSCEVVTDSKCGEPFVKLAPIVGSARHDRFQGSRRTLRWRVPQMARAVD